MKLNQEQLDNLLFQYRPFAVKIDGIWRAAMGVYIPPIKDPLNVKCILNGKEIMVSGQNNYCDYFGCLLRDLDVEVIRLNMSTLPQRLPKMKPVLARPPRRDNVGPILEPMPGGVPLPDNTNEQF